MITSKVVVTDALGKVLEIFTYDATNDAGRDSRKQQALGAAVKFIGYEIQPTGRGNGTIYRSEKHEIGLLNSGTIVNVGDYL
jgi:hypothetical protein